MLNFYLSGVLYRVRETPHYIKEENLTLECVKHKHHKLPMNAADQ